MPLGAVSIPFREDLYSDQEKSPKKRKGSQLFPSLSGKTSIRTQSAQKLPDIWLPKVSIPFREDLYSDQMTSSARKGSVRFGFHPFQGRPLFGPESSLQESAVRLRFHPFQGRPLFGQIQAALRPKGVGEFPSLSGKTSIRTQGESAKAFFHAKMFPSLSGKTSIRTEHRLDW